MHQRSVPESMGQRLTNDEIVSVYRLHEYTIRAVWRVQKGTMRDAVEFYLERHPQYHPHHKP